MSQEIERAESQAPATIAAVAIELQAVQADVLLARRAAVEKVVREVMVNGVHYGEIPGVKGKMLKKPGTEILAACFQLGIDYQVETLPDDDAGRRYVVKATVTHQPSGTELGSGMGECSTNETKWKWRKAYKEEWDDTPADRRRKKHGFDPKKKEHYDVLQVRQEIADVANTVLKQACKRAAADAVLGVLGVRGVVLQSDGGGSDPGGFGGQQRPAPRPAKAGAAKVKEMIAAASAKGISEGEVLSRLQRQGGFKGDKLADIGLDDFQWVMNGVADLPDLDPVTGEVIEGEAEEVTGEGSETLL